MSVRNAPREGHSEAQDTRLIIHSVLFYISYMNESVDILEELASIVRAKFPDGIVDGVRLADNIINGSTRSFVDEDKALLRSMIVNSFLYGIFYSLDKTSKVAE